MCFLKPICWEMYDGFWPKSSVMLLFSDSVLEIKLKKSIPHVHWWKKKKKSWRCTTAGGVCLADLSCLKHTYEDIVLSKLHSRPEEIGSVSKHVCLWACVSAEAFKMPRHRFPLSLSFAIIPHLAPQHTLRHAVATAHRHMLTLVNTHIISGLSPLQKLYLLQSCQAMKWLVLAQNGVAVQWQELGTSADTHNCVSTRYCDLSRFRWNLFSFWILILGTELWEG